SDGCAKRKSAHSPSHESGRPPSGCLLGQSGEVQQAGMLSATEPRDRLDGGPPLLLAGGLAPTSAVAGLKSQMSSEEGLAACGKASVPVKSKGVGSGGFAMAVRELDPSSADAWKTESSKGKRLSMSGEKSS